MLKNKKLLVVFLLSFYSCTFNSEIENLGETQTITQDSKTTTSVQEVGNTDYIFERPYQHTFVELDKCYDFLGSNVSVSCIPGVEILQEIIFEDSVTNVVPYRENFIIILKSGKIYDFNFQSGSKKLLFSVEGQVLRDGEENGLLSFAIHPYNNEFIISYVSLENKLIFEIVKYVEDLSEVVSSSKIIELQSNTNSHYGGKVIWSDYYNCFLGSVGDISEANFESRLNSSPLDSSKVTGKIIGLNCDLKQFSQKVNLSINGQEVSQNIIASGLRNPWQFFEFRDNLIIFDTGFTQNEELNIAKLSEDNINFGWPVFEGPKRAQDLDNIDDYSLDIFHWVEGDSFDAVEYIEKNSIKPTFYYNHHPCNSLDFTNCDGKGEVYRAAIIGGGILENPRSKYNFDIFFADYLSQELFSLNFITRELKIYPVENYLYINSVNIFDAEKNQIITTTNSGKVLLLQLP